MTPFLAFPSTNHPLILFCSFILKVEAMTNYLAGSSSSQEAGTDSLLLGDMNPIVNTKRNKDSWSQDEDVSGLTLSLFCSREVKRARASKSMFNAEDASFETKNISLEVTLFDKTWISTGTVYAKRMLEERSLAAEKIERMRFYTPEEEEEERRKGVCTKLTLYTEPWTIKKRLTMSDLNGSCRLLIGSKVVKEHILPYLTDECLKDVRESGARMAVWDEDTKSEHALMFKFWTSSRCYILND